MTAQFPDRLTYRGAHYNMNSFPITAEMIERACLKKNGSVNSGCWRGYIGTWEIRDDDRLYLTDMELISFEPRTMDEMFGCGDRGLEATWVNGEIACTAGEVLGYRMGFAVFERDVKFIFDKGRVVSVEERHNDPPTKG